MTDPEPFGVYVHWPFCKAKCPYCDFNSHVRHGGIDEARFLAAYRAELEYFASLAPGFGPESGAPAQATQARSSLYYKNSTAGFKLGTEFR